MLGIPSLSEKCRNAWQKKKSRGPLSMQVRGQAVGYQGLRVEGSGRLPSNAWWQWQSAHTYFAPLLCSSVILPIIYRILLTVVCLVLASSSLHKQSLHGLVKMTINN